MSGNILVITDSGMTQGLRSQLEKYMRAAEINIVNTRMVTNLTKGLQVRETKTRMAADPAKRELFFERLQHDIDRYHATTLVINDWVALEYFTGKHRSLDLTRGGVYFYNGIPAIVVDSLRLKTGGNKLAVVNHAGWLLRQDLKKTKRWHEGKQAHEPRFDFRLVRNREDLAAFERDAARSICIAMDLETTGVGSNCLISCSGYAMLQPNGAVISWVIPLLDPIAEGGNFWEPEAFGDALAAMRRVHANEVPKIMQNGSYDTHYYTRYRMPVRNWILDTAVAFHSIWPEIPKRIDFICSVAVDHYRFWKDEGKEDAKDDVKNGKLPSTQGSWDKYLRYCALDCHYTLLAGKYVMRILDTVPWAMHNYRESMRQTLGPASAMSMRGVRVNKKLQSHFTNELQREHHNALNDLHVMVGDSEFNPNSPHQMQSLLYDVMQAEPLPGGRGQKNARSTDEKALGIVMTQHPLLECIIKQVWAAKKPRNNVSKYGVPYKDEKNKWHGLFLMNNRWMYKMNAIGTETGRYASKSSDYWIGTQIQNAPYPMRAMVEPDPGYVLFDFDYSKADFWHTAFASKEPNMMKVALDTSLDVHCYHASKFFSKPYEEIYAGYKNKEPWVIDSLHGVRQNAKRIVYGANYLMRGMTLLMQMGIEAVQATAAQMNVSASGWSIKQYANFCQQLLDFYFSDMYPALLPWIEETVRRTVQRGNQATCCGGRTRTFFANLISNKAGQRELAAYYGQGGTAYTMNTVMDRVYYAMDSQDLMLLLQVHDSIVGQVREDKLHLLADLKDMMEIENEFEGNKFVIPVEGDVGFGWGFRMCGWHPEITIEQIREADKKWFQKQGIAA